MKTAPILSIITPVYNGEKFVGGCIESVVAQNCAGIEHIVVDGGSTDRTVQILRDKAKTYPHLRWISEPDRGQSDAQNKGIAMARAEYIGILNADDFYEPGALPRVSAIINELSGPRFIVGDCNILTSGDQLLRVNRPAVPKFENIIVDEATWPFPCNPGAYFYPKSLHDVVGPYNVEEHQAMDVEFVLAAVQAIEPLYISVVLANFRHIPGTKTFSCIEDGALGPIVRRVRRAAWRRAPLKTKLRVVLLWITHRPYRLKVVYWGFRNRRAWRANQRRTRRADA